MINRFVIGVVAVTIFMVGLVACKPSPVKSDSPELFKSVRSKDVDFGIGGGSAINVIKDTETGVEYIVIQKISQDGGIAITPRLKAQP